MRRIIHLSDLHFCRTNPAVVSALEESAHRLAPDLIAVSGDLTQRATKREFDAAKAFLGVLPAPRVVVPGNHDIPLYDIATRLFKPHVRFQEHFDMDLEPVYQDDEITVAGVNTARAFTFKRGRINSKQVQRVSALFCGKVNRRVKILVTHHPFDLPPSASKRELVGRAEMAMAGFRDCMPDLLLAGHMHVHGVMTTAARYHLGSRSAIVVQAGTATSTRVRGERNSFNLLHVDQDRIAVDRFDWLPDRQAFDVETTQAFIRRGGSWETADVTAFR